MLDPNLIDRLLQNDELGQSEVQERLRMYERQAAKFEQYRQDVAEWLIAQGIAEDDTGWRAAEAPVTKRTRPKRFADMKFTDEQLAIAKRSLSQPVFSRYDGF